MFANMSSDSTNGSGEGSSAPPRAKPKTYQKKSQLEHILLRPEAYIGSLEKVNEMMWVYDTEKEMMVQKQIEYVPALYKIFDEILVNAADNKQRDKAMDCIKIEIKPDENMISIWNNGLGIPVAIHKDENMYVPTMIFGHLPTSSNYNDKEEKVKGGRNGYGAKLCNIFSDKFIVETACKQYHSKFRQTWTSNMSKTYEPELVDFSGEDYAKITFHPDLKKLKMDKLDADIVGLMSRRAYDIAASTRGVKVFLNGQMLPVKVFKDYVDLFIKGKEDEMGNDLKVVYEQPNERWEIAVTMSDHGFQQMSFVNKIATTKGGRHVDYVVDGIIKRLLKIVKKKNKGGIVFKPFEVKNRMWIFINCLIVNPTFDSQTKENMTLQVNSFGSKCNLSEKFFLNVQKSGILWELSWAEQNDLRTLLHLKDANEAGTENGLKCTLILTEGDSAQSLAFSWLTVFGKEWRDYHGLFVLRGKLLNVRKATHKKILENAKINNLMKIIGLEYKKKYRDPDDMTSLRYGKIMIITDQNPNGSHSKGLLFNFIHHNWPELLRQNFLEQFITPVFKACKTNLELSFYSVPEFEKWKKDTPNHHTFQIKYYEGLGSSTSDEIKEYFSNMARHRIPFKYHGQEDDDHIVLAFSKKHVQARKKWLTNLMRDSKRRKEKGLPEKCLYTKETKHVNFKDFINLELAMFFNAGNIRSVPCLVDGLKPTQRKVLFTFLKRDDERRVNVGELATSVAEHSANAHTELLAKIEASLWKIIVNLAQNFVGSNNINLLEPIGQFGTRFAGGKDWASIWHLFTKMSPLTRLIFHPHDDGLLKHEYDKYQQKFEPVWYIPIIPMILVNGADSVGTGCMTKIPKYNPRDLVKCIRSLLDGEEPKQLIPWYKNFKGTIEYIGDNRYCVSGEISYSGNKLEITELPVGTWTENYRAEVLEPMVKDSHKKRAISKAYRCYCEYTTVNFVVSPKKNQLKKMKKKGLHKVFKLQTLLNPTSMCCFDELGCLRRYESVMEILKEFYTLRLHMYQKRKEFLEDMLQAEADQLFDQARDNKIAELEVLKRKSNKDLWREDLDMFMKKLDEVEENERREEATILSNSDEDLCCTLIASGAKHKHKKARAK